MELRGHSFIPISDPENMFVLNSSLVTAEATSGVTHLHTSTDYNPIKIQRHVSEEKLIQGVVIFWENIDIAYDIGKHDFKTVEEL